MVDMVVHDGSLIMPFGAGMYAGMNETSQRSACSACSNAAFLFVWQRPNEKAPVCCCGKRVHLTNSKGTKQTERQNKPNTSFPIMMYNKYFINTFLYGVLLISPSTTTVAEAANVSSGRSLRGGIKQDANSVFRRMNFEAGQYWAQTSLFPVHYEDMYCHNYYKEVSDESCAGGASFEEARAQCQRDGPEKCLGVLWNPCTGQTSDTSVPGAYKLVRNTGAEENSLSDMPGKCNYEDSYGHWDFFQVSPVHYENTYCYDVHIEVGDGTCSGGASFDDAWAHCRQYGHHCKGVLWNSCTGHSSDASVPGSYKLVGDFSSCDIGGGLGHWSLFERKDFD